MNRTGLDITNTFATIASSWFADPKFAADKSQRIVLATGGFGCSPEANGNAVFVEFAIDGEKGRVEGYHLEENLPTRDEVATALKARTVAPSKEIESAFAAMTEANAS